MKPLELRINNLIYIPKTGQIAEIAFVDMIGRIGVNKDVLNLGQLIIEDLEPIPLEEEWLTRFGFEKTSHGFYRYPIEVRTNGPVVTMLGHKSSLRNIGLNPKYVHQLQNLYFALTGEELKTSNK